MLLLDHGTEATVFTVVVRERNGNFFMVPTVIITDTCERAGYCSRVGVHVYICVHKKNCNLVN